jgi:hypothetical protein
MIPANPPLNYFVGTQSNRPKWKVSTNNFTIHNQSSYLFPKKHHGYWTHNGGINMRIHLESVARVCGFDPLLADNWYSRGLQDLEQHRVSSHPSPSLSLLPLPILTNNLQEVKAVIRYYGNSLIQALLDLFPELNLDVKKFSVMPCIFSCFQFFN